MGMETTSTHPWTHFGPGPYRYVGTKRKVHVSNGGGWLSESRERAGSTCDHCGTAITYAFAFRAANGVEFVVGSSCAEKANQDFGGVEVARMKFDAARQRKEAKVAAAKAKTIQQWPSILELLDHQRITDRWLAGVAQGMAVQFHQTGRLSGKQVEWLWKMPRD